MPYYAVKVGRKNGIYETWDECKRMTEGVANSIYRKFETRTQAEEYMSKGQRNIPNFVPMLSPSALNKPVQTKIEKIDDVLLLSDDEMDVKPKIPKLESPPTISNFVAFNDRVQPCTSHSNEMHSDTRRKLQTVIETAVKVAISCNDFNNCNLLGVAMNTANQSIKVDVNVNFLCDCTCKSVNTNPQVQVTPSPVSRKRKATRNVSNALGGFSFPGTANDIVPVPRKPAKRQAPSRIKTARTHLAATSEGERVVVYTDGACENNGFAGAQGGIGIAQNLN